MPLAETAAHTITCSGYFCKFHICRGVGIVGCVETRIGGHASSIQSEITLIIHDDFIILIIRSHISSQPAYSCFLLNFLLWYGQGGTTSLSVCHTSFLNYL